MIVDISTEDRKFGQAVLHTMNPETINRGYEELQELEDYGYPEAAVVLGQYFRNSDVGKARKHFEFAAEYEIGEAFWGLAQTIPHSSVLSLDSQRDLRWFRCVRTAAEKACTEAQVELARSYRQLGYNAPAAYWYQMAKLYGHEDAGFQLDILSDLWQGSGCPADPAQLPEAFTELQRDCGMLVLRLTTKARDYDTVYQLTQNALKEDAMAELSLAAIYEGNGNMENAGKVYRIAASHEEPYAMKRCGDLHMAGTGLPPDGDLAVKMYADAATAGERTAMYELGRCADAFEQDREKMAFWFAKAHVRGHRMATEEMRKLIYN